MTSKIQKWIIAHRIHLIGWALYILAEVTLIGFAAGKFGDLEAYIIHYSLNIILFYTNAFLVFNTRSPNFERSVLVVIFLLIVEILIFVSLKALADAMLLKNLFSKNPFDFVDLAYLLRTLWRVILFMGLSCFYVMFLRYKIERKETEILRRQDLEGKVRNNELEIALHEATNAYLKAQINPHFIFNILGFIHDGVLRTDAQAAQAVIDLSDLMRFAIHSGDMDSEPPLCDEIDQIESLIRLYRVRFKDRVFVEFNYADQAGEFRLIPLVLLTLVENLFKHGDIHKEREPARIDITTTDSSITICTINLKKNHSEKNGFNKGIDNIRTRLDLNYPDRFSLDYGTADSGHFFVRLSVFN